ncbi:MAG: ABC transporter ATP-binding protein [Candidatus Velthaea sp.]
MNSPTPAAPPIRIDRVTQRYQTRDRVVEALRDCTLSIEPGAFACIVGPSGCGKSTLLDLIGGLQKPTEGSVSFGAGAGRTATVFQQPALFPWMTVVDNVAVGLESDGQRRADALAAATAVLARVGLEGFGRAYPHELSGGMAQRVGIARALALDPAVLVMDEPFAAVDAHTRIYLQDEVRALTSDHRMTTVFVTHDVNEAVYLGDQVFVMSGRPGTILREIRIDRSISDRADPYFAKVASEVFHLLAPPTDMVSHDR